MKQRDKAHVESMLSAIDRAELFTAGPPPTDFDVDQKTTYALAWALVLMGEAATRTSDETRTECPAVPWKEMAETAKNLKQSYWEHDAALIWATFRERIPAIRSTLRRLMGGIDHS